VQAFFVISGFYMELLRKKYAVVPTWIFYSNRYSRLIVSYWIVCAATVLLIVFYASHIIPGGELHIRQCRGVATDWIFQCHDLWAGFDLTPFASAVERIADPAKLVARARVTLLCACPSSMARIGENVVEHSRCEPATAIDHCFVHAVLFSMAAAFLFG
jgi:hypothetical protein